jgi:hypothetical protein
LREITALSFILEARCFIDQRDNSDPSEAPHEKLALIGNMSLLCQEPPWHPTRGKNRITNISKDSRFVPVSSLPSRHWPEQNRVADAHG